MNQLQILKCEPQFLNVRAKVPPPTTGSSRVCHMMMSFFKLASSIRQGAGAGECLPDGCLSPSLKWSVKTEGLLTVRDASDLLHSGPRCEFEEKHLT